MHPDLRDSRGWCPECWRNHGQASWLKTTDRPDTLICALRAHQITLIPYEY